MKASSVGIEFFVKLSEEEIRKLESETLRGEIKIRIRERTLGNFPLDIRVGKTDKNHPYISYETVPFNVHIEDSAGFIFTLSKEGYETLKRTGLTGDRMYENNGCKIKIRSENY